MQMIENQNNKIRRQLSLLFYQQGVLINKYEP